MNILLVSHDLSATGAPQVLFNLALSLKRQGHYVLVVAPLGGPFQSRMQQEGLTVVIDPDCLHGHPPLQKLASQFDLVIGNTILAWRLPQSLRGLSRVWVYLHETHMIEIACKKHPETIQSLSCADGLLSVSPLTQRILKENSGLDSDLLLCHTEFPPRFPPRSGQATIIALVGTYDARKAQDLAITGFARLPATMRQHCALICAGATADAAYKQSILQLAAQTTGVHLLDGMDHAKTLEFISQSNIVLIPSRSEAMSLVALEAMSMGKVILCSDRTGISEYLQDGISCFVIASLDAEGIALGIQRALRQKADWPRIAAQARAIHKRLFSRAPFDQRVAEWIQGIQAVPLHPTTIA